MSELGRANEVEAMGPDDQVLAALVATRFYEDGMTKQDIGADLGLSRFKVARLLEGARHEGIVQIAIELPSGLDPSLSDRLRQAFGLRRTLVVRCPKETPLRRRYLGRAAAELLGDIATEEDCLGIAWGRTLSAMTESLRRLATCPVVQLTGVAGTISENSVELVRQVSAVSGGPAYPIYAPLVVSDAETCQGLRRQPAIATAITQFAQVTKAAVAIGSWEPPDSQLRDSLTARERSGLVERGVRAEICSTLLDTDGAVVSGLHERCIAISLEQLRAIPEVIAVAGGPSKVGAVRSVLRAGLAHSLVTDTVVAEDLLAELAAS